MYDIIKHPLSTEKNIRLLESENKLVFEVALDATRIQIKKAVEEMFKVKVVSVNTLRTPAGKKRAYVRLTKEFPAIDIATDLGLM
ncbi:MAG TPA: 50S ribosomal protein L23 [Candidatus Nanoarchaeia archaeon]|nr:50S ribosomal protein L23 [Candidatus Nanoarchaeia archaeon]